MAQSMSDIDEVTVAHIDISTKTNVHVKLLCRFGEVRVDV